MKKVLLPILFLLIIGTSNSQWVSNYWGNQEGDININNAKGMAVTTDNSGKCLVAGYIQGAYSGNDIVVMKYNSNGDTLWTRVYNGQGNSEDKAFGIVTDNVNNVYVTGSVTVQGRGLEVVLLKYSANGILQWAKTYGVTTNNFNDEGLAIALDNSGNPYVTGYCTNNDGITDMLTLKYLSNGTLAFSKTFDGQENLGARAFGIVVDGDNFIYITGYVTTSARKEDIAVVKYGPQGNEKWTTVYNAGSSTSNEDKAFGIAVDAANNIYVAGYVSNDNSGENTDAVLIKYNSNGSLKWNETYSGLGNESEDKAWGIIVDDDKNSVYITGQTENGSHGLDYLTVNYNFSGTEKWVNTYNGTGNGSDVANSIALLSGNKVVVTGASWGTNQNNDFATIRLNNNGINVGTNRYSMSGNSDDIAKDISTNPSGSGSNTIYVTGFSELVVDGQSNQSAISTVMEMDVDDNAEEQVNQPEKFELHQNYPNPFNPSTVIKFDISESSNVKLVVYDMLGKVVDVLADGFLESGSYSINFTNKNLASGIYFYEFQAGNYRDIKKMTLIK